MSWGPICKLRVVACNCGRAGAPWGGGLLLRAAGLRQRAAPQCPRRCLAASCATAAAGAVTRRAEPTRASPACRAAAVTALPMPPAGQSAPAYFFAAAAAPATALLLHCVFWNRCCALLAAVAAEQPARGRGRAALARCDCLAIPCRTHRLHSLPRLHRFFPLLLLALHCPAMLSALPSAPLLRVSQRCTRLEKVAHPSLPHSRLLPRKSFSPFLFRASAQ